MDAGRFRLENHEANLVMTKNQIYFAFGHPLACCKICAASKAEKREAAKLEKGNRRGAIGQ